MGTIKLILILVTLPFVIALLSIVCVVLVMLPFIILALLMQIIVYKFDWRKMMDMEYGFEFRKYDENGKRIK